MPYPVPPPATFVQTSSQSEVKLSKLIKEVRLLGCETFSVTIDAVVAKNWLKRVTDLKLCISTPITRELFVQEFNDHSIHGFIEIRRGKSSSD